MDTFSYQDPYEPVYNKRVRGVFFVSTQDDKRGHFHFGCWVSQCSHKPPRMLVCFPKEMEGAEIVQRSKKFALSMVSHEQEDFHDTFFSGKQDPDALGRDLFFTKETGCLILKEAQAYYDCEAVNFIDNGDFLIVIGDIIDAGILHPERTSLTVNHLIHRPTKPSMEEAIVPLKGFDLE